VAVGKSTTARLLQELLRRAPGKPKVDLITTDGFLLPTAELEKRGLMDRKGFPESYDRRALLQFVIDVKSGEPRVTAPVYSHKIYDIIPGERAVIENPDILIVEGLNVLLPARVDAQGRSGAAISDFFDFSVYVDADEADIKRWFLDRFMVLRDTAFRDPESFFKRFTQLSRAEALQFGSHVWDTINGPNLRENIVTTRDRATAVLRKGPDHRVQTIAIRKV
jgi:pantothenate kinase